MSRREAFIDEGFGERRGVVLLDGRPERLIIERDGDIACQKLGKTGSIRPASSSINTTNRGRRSAVLFFPMCAV